MSRPPVSVIVPFHGDLGAGQPLLEALAAVRLGPADEVLIADNTDDYALRSLDAPPAVRVFATAVKRQPYTARNEAARRAGGEWLLFTDADCVPEPDLLEAYFAGPVPDGWGAVAGEVVALPGQHGLAARYGRERELLRQGAFLRHPYRPMAVTANLLVRRAAFDAVGGFAEGMRSGGDADLCWRLQEAGWELGHRPAARVAHAHRETVPALLRQVMRTSAGTTWLNRRFPGSAVRAPVIRSLARAGAGAVWWAARGQPARGLLRLVDALVICAEAIGNGLGNARREGPPRGHEVIVAEEAQAIAGAPYVEAARRPRAGAPGAGVMLGEDDGPARRVLDAAAVAVRRPRAAVRHRRLLLELAPAARRVRASGARRVTPASADAHGRAVALAALSGLDQPPA